MSSFSTGSVFASLLIRLAFWTIFCSAKNFCVSSLCVGLVGVYFRESIVSCENLGTFCFGGWNLFGVQVVLIGVGPGFAWVPNVSVSYCCVFWDWELFM